MKQEEMIREYLDRTNEILKKEAPLFQLKLEEEKQRLLREVTEGLKSLCRKVWDLQETDTEYKVCYFQVSLLRHAMNQDKYLLLLSAHDPTYFLDRRSVSEKLDITWLFAPLIKAGEEAVEAAVKYRGKVDILLRYQAMMAQAFAHNHLLADIFRREWTDFEELEAVQRVKKESCYLVKWGGYREESETIYRMDYEEKNQTQFVNYNEKNTVMEPCGRYHYQSWDNTAFTELEVIKMDLMFAGFKNARITKCVMQASFLYGAKFKKAGLSWCVFEGVSLERADFREAVLCNVVFLNCMLRDADFRECHMEEVYFEESNLTGCVFLRQDVPGLLLDDRQLQQILIEEEKLDVFHLGGR